MESLSILSVFEWSALIVLLFMLGGIAGFSAGLLGVGGGIILVPGLFYLFSYLGFAPEHLMHMALGTSLSIIVPTGISSARAHWKKGAVRIDLVKRIGIGIVIGVAGGTILVGEINSRALEMFFASFMVVIVVLLFSNPSRFKICSDVPGQPWAGIAGVINGLVSTLVGIGGASLNVPYMCACQVKMHKAVGTASALGLVIAVPASIGFIMIGWGVSGRPPLSIGYINAPAWIVISSVSVMIAPIGVSLAHKLPVDPLRKVFAGYILLLALKMWFDILSGGS